MRSRPGALGLALALALCACGVGAPGRAPGGGAEGVEQAGPVPAALSSALFAERVGFAAGVTGGAAGPLRRVTRLDDAGPGSLREAASRPGWVVFDVEGEIVLESPVRLAGDLTLDGRGRQVRLRGEGLVAQGVSNVIVTDLTFAGGDGGGNNDALALRESQGVWVHHCAFSGYGDGLLDVTRQATDVTVSWCRFTDHRKTMLIGASAAHEADRVIRVSLHHNWFFGTESRHPRLRYGRVHAWNNLLEGWGSYGMGASQEGQLLSERNVFLAGKSKAALLTRVHEDPAPGAARSEGDLLLRGAVVQEGGEVFQAHALYDYALEPADLELAARIRAGAGPRP